MQAATKTIKRSGGGPNIDEANREVTRLNLALPPGTRERIESLQHAIGASTITDTVVRALRMCEWLAQQEAEGRSLLVQEPGKDPVIVKFVF